jgi:hypothetical protein
LSPTAYTQGYQPFAFADFSGGINLRDKSDVVTDKEAIDLLNVTFNERGAIRQRDGYADLTTADLTNRVDSLAPFYNASGIKQLIAGCGTRLEALSTAGAVVASKTGLVGGPYSFARFAAPGSEFMYAANGADTLQRWDGSAWTAPTATVNGTAGQVMPKAGSITVTAAMAGTASGTNAANRLVATAYGTQTTAGPGGSTSTPSRVHFSNAGQPEIWETDGASGRGRNFLDLTPGDGEQIMAAVTWRELVFVFKETKFFVMWGESTAADGTPIFNFREIVNSTGLASKQSVAVDQDELHHGFATGANRVGHRNRGSTIDRTATTITSRWRSGWGDYGNSLQKTIRETKAWGSGAVTASFSTDFNGAQIASLTALFGISTNWPTTGTWADFITLNNGLWPGGGQINDVQLRRAVRGTAFSTQFANNPLSTTWSIHRVVRNLREIRGASVR